MRQKIGQIIELAPPAPPVVNCIPPPIWEILDPPLRTIKGSSVLEQKRIRKRRHLEWIHSFPMNMFLLSSGKDKENSGFRFHVRSNINEP